MLQHMCSRLLVALLCGRAVASAVLDLLKGLLSNTLSTPESMQMLVQGLLSNVAASKLLLKYMQGKAGLRTKMVLWRKEMKVDIHNMCVPHAPSSLECGKY